MTLDKRLVDEVIRLTKKYYETKNTGYLSILNEAREALKEKSTRTVADLLTVLAKYIQVSGKGTYDDIYEALEVYGIIVEDKELENDKK